MGNGMTPRPDRSLYHAIRLGCSESSLNGPEMNFASRLVDDTEIGIEERGSDLQKPRFNHVGDIKEVP